MRLEDSAQVWLPGRAVGAWAPPTGLEARTIRPEHLVRAVERACDSWTRCPLDDRGPVPFSQHLAESNAVRPPVYPVQYWAALRAQRLETEAANMRAQSVGSTGDRPTVHAEFGPAARRADSGTEPVNNERPLNSTARVGDPAPEARAALVRRVETAYEVQRFAAAGNLVDLVI